MSEASNVPTNVPTNVRIQHAVSAWLQKFPMPIRVILGIVIFIVWLVLFIVMLPGYVILGTALVLWGVGVYCKAKVIVHLPIKYQRKYYERYKKHLATDVASKLGPLMAYPFVMFVELELDKHFEEGGMKEVLKQVEGFGDRMVRRLENVKENVLDKIGEGGDRTGAAAYAMGMGMLFDPAEPRGFQPGDTTKVEGWATASPVKTDVSMASKKDELAAAIAALNSGQPAPSDEETENVDDEKVS